MILTSDGDKQRLQKVLKGIPTEANRSNKEVHEAALNRGGLRYSQVAFIFESIFKAMRLKREKYLALKQRLNGMHLDFIQPRQKSRLECQVEDLDSTELHVQIDFDSWSVYSSSGATDSILKTELGESGKEIIAGKADFQSHLNILDMFFPDDDAVSFYDDIDLGDSEDIETMRHYIECLFEPFLRIGTGFNWDDSRNTLYFAIDMNRINEAEETIRDGLNRGSLFSALNGNARK